MVLLSGPRCALGGNCGKILAHLRGPIDQRWWLFDPNGPAGARWTNLTAPPENYSNNSVTGVQGAVLLTGGLDECGDNCGKVFIVSGNGSDPNPPTAELYDPADNSFEQVPYGPLTGSDPLTGPQIFAEVVRLRDGRVLGSGSQCDPGGFNCRGAAGLFDPPTKEFKPAASPGNTEGGLGTPAAPVLPNGDVLFTNNVYNLDYPGEIYRPDPNGGPGQWRPVSTCSPDPSSKFCHTLASLPDGKVVAVTGDLDNGGYEFPFGLNGQVYLFDPVQEKWFRTADLLDPPNTNSPHWAVVLTGPGCGTNCGKVLAAGNGRLSLFTP